MKTLQTVACTFLLSASFLLQAGASDLQDLLSEGQTAYMRGDLEAAKAAFKLAYQLDSHNPTVIGFLRRIKVDEEQRPKGNMLEKQYAAILIPQVQFHEASLSSALEYIRTTVTKVTNGKQSINFVVQAPAEQTNAQTLTLSLSNVPLTEVLRYIGTVSNMTFEYDKYAVLVKPRAAGGEPAPAPAPTTANQ